VQEDQLSLLLEVTLAMGQTLGMNVYEDGKKGVSSMPLVSVKSV